MYKAAVARNCDVMQWGYEVETLLVARQGHWKLHLDIEQAEQLDVPQLSLSKEFARFQLEAMPRTPFSSAIHDICLIRGQIAELCRARPIALLTNFPRLGCPNSLWPEPATGCWQWTARRT